MEPITLRDREPSTYVTSNWLAGNMAIEEDRLRDKGREQPYIDGYVQRVMEDLEAKDAQRIQRLAEAIGTIVFTGTHKPYGSTGSPSMYGDASSGAPEHLRPRECDTIIGRRLDNTFGYVPRIEWLGDEGRAALWRMLSVDPSSTRGPEVEEAP